MYTYVWACKLDEDLFINGHWLLRNNTILSTREINATQQTSQL